MKSAFKYLSFMIILAILLSGCTPAHPGTTSSTVPTTQAQPTTPGTTQTIPATVPTVPVTRPTDPPTEPPTDPPTYPPTVPPTDPPTTPPTDPTTVPPTEPPTTDPTVPEAILVESITLSAPKTTIKVMEQLQITAAILPENADVLTVMYVSTGGQVLDNGVFFAAEPGVYVVTAHAMDDSGVTGSITIIVEAAPVTGIAISGGRTVAVGRTLQLQAVVSPEYASDPSVTWSILSGAELASIDQNGLLTAIAPGEVVVQAAANDGSGVKATHKVEITPVFVTSITISGGKKVTVGNTLQLSAEVEPGDAADPSVTWSIVSGGEYATIDQNGLLTAIAPGKVTVQVMANDGSGVKATHKLEVQPVLVTELTISGASTVKVGKTIQLSVTILPENAENMAVKWSISKGSKYAKISEDGVLTGVAAGKVTVKVTAQDGSGVSATFTVTVEEAAGAWEGSGTKDDPFLIAGLEDLMNLRDVLNKSGYYFLLVADIDCSSVEWIAIGNEEKPFMHHFDGGNYTIKNLNLKCSEDYNKVFGLFGRVENASFKNIHIENATLCEDSLTNIGLATIGALSASAYNCTFENCSASVDFQAGGPVGGLVGSLQFASNQKVVMDNCHTSGKIKGGYAGGLVGQIFAQEDYYSSGEEPKASVKNCSSSVDLLEGSGGYVGGLIGQMEYISVYNCHATGDISNSGRFLGGLIGHAQWKGEVAYCYATGTVSATSNAQYGFAHAGGLIGYMNSYVSVHDCYATGDVHSVAIWSDCQDYPSMDGGIWLNYRNPCGSLIGTLDAGFGPRYGYKINVYNCYATGYVYADKICESEKTYCHGALIGFVFDDSTRRFMIDSSKDDQSDWAGFYDSAVGIFGNNYNLEDLRTYYTPMVEWLRYYGAKHDAMPTWEYVQIVDKAALKDQATFAGWDFENVWKMGSNGPELRNNAKADTKPDVPGPAITPASANLSVRAMTVIAI